MIKGEFKIGDIVTIAFLCIVMFFPVGFNIIKISLMLIMVLTTIYRRVIINIPIYVFIYVASNIFFLLISIFKGIPITLNIMIFYTIYPFLFTISFSIINKAELFVIISKTIVIMGAVIALYDSIFALSSYLGISLPNWFYFEELELLYSNYTGYIHFTSRHLGVLLFTAPFTFTLYLGEDNNNAYFISKKLLLISFFIQALCIILSTRVALIVILFCSFPIIVFLKIISGRNRIRIKITLIKLITFFIIVIIISIIIFKFNRYLLIVCEFVIEKVKNEFSSNSNEIRTIQSKLLIKGWLSSPIIGNGIGSSLNEMIRDSENLGSYELVYHATLFQTGIVGLVITFYYYLSILKSLLEKSFNGTKKNIYSIAYAAGLLCFLIANSVDPYLSKFGFMWVLYLPLIVGIKYNNLSHTSNLSYLHYKIR